MLETEELHPSPLSLVIDEKARQIRKTFGGLSGSPESE